MTQKSEELVQRLKGELALSDPNWRLGPLFRDLITHIEGTFDDSAAICGLLNTIAEQEFEIEQLKDEPDGVDAYMEILDRPGFKAVAEQYDGEENEQ